MLVARYKSRPQQHPSFILNTRSHIHSTNVFQKYTKRTPKQTHQNTKREDIDAIHLPNKKNSNSLHHTRAVRFIPLQFYIPFTLPSTYTHHILHTKPSYLGTLRFQFTHITQEAISDKNQKATRLKRHTNQSCMTDEKLLNKSSQNSQLLFLSFRQPAHQTGKPLPKSRMTALGKENRQTFDGSRFAKDKEAS